MTNEEKEKKRLFLAAEVRAPWPETFPKGRVLDVDCRHITLAFLGDVLFAPLRERLSSSFPLPSFTVGRVGVFDRCLFLPRRHPRVVAWHVRWAEEVDSLGLYQTEIAEWLRGRGYAVDKREFLPHLTIARSPFYPREWRKAFQKLPMMVTGIHLYESVGKLVYKPLWSHPLLPPFEELDHTADLAFVVRGESLQQVERHAQAALAFAFPAILAFLLADKEPRSLDDIIIGLNDLISRCDQEIGAPFKAVSFHGDLLESQERKGILEWEMIVDV